MNTNDDIKCFISNALLLLSFFLFLFSYCNLGFFNIWQKYSTFYLFIVYILFMILNFKNEDKKRLFIFIMIILLLFFNSLLSDYSIGSCVSILNVFLFALLADKVRTNLLFLNFYKILTIFFYFIFLLSDHNFLNTNFVGYIYFLFYLLFANLFDLYNGGFIKKAINLVLLMVTLYFGNQYECRTVQLVVIIIFVIQSFFSKLLVDKKIKRIIPYGLTIGSLAVAFIYVYLWKINFYVDLSRFASKSLFSGRNKIWEECFKIIRSHPLVGVGANYQLKSHFAYALHNSMMMIITTFGIPIFCLFVYVFKMFINNLYKQYYDNKNFLFMIITIIAIFGIDFFESYFYWSLFNYISFIIIGVSINKGLYNKKNIKQGVLK